LFFGFFGLVCFGVVCLFVFFVFSFFWGVWFFSFFLLRVLFSFAGRIFSLFGVDPGLSNPFQFALVAVVGVRCPLGNPPTGRFFLFLPLEFTCGWGGRTSSLEPQLKHLAGQTAPPVSPSSARPPEHLLSAFQRPLPAPSSRVCDMVPSPVRILSVFTLRGRLPGRAEDDFFSNGGRPNFLVCRKGAVHTPLYGGRLPFRGLFCSGIHHVRSFFFSKIGCGCYLCPPPVLLVLLPINFPRPRYVFFC